MRGRQLDVGVAVEGKSKIPEGEMQGKMHNADFMHQHQKTAFCVFISHIQQSISTKSALTLVQNMVLNLGLWKSKLDCCAENVFRSGYY